MRKTDLSEGPVARRVQESLERIYRIRLDSDIQQYIIDSGTLDALARHLGIPSQPCQVILHEGEQATEIAVHVDEEILARLEDANPLETLSAATLGDFCALAEEVSHFVYLVWNIRNERSVRRLEIELQAEVDKYVLCALILLGQSRPEGLRGLLARLFHRFRLDERLDVGERERYLRANGLALRYCSFLEARFLRRASTPDLLHEIRYFYRLPQEEKIHRIRRLPLH